MVLLLLLPELPSLRQTMIGRRAMTTSTTQAEGGTNTIVSENAMTAQQWAVENQARIAVATTIATAVDAVIKLGLRNDV